MFVLIWTYGSLSLFIALLSFAPLSATERGVLVNGAAFVKGGQRQEVPLTIIRRKIHRLRVLVFSKKGSKKTLEYDGTILPHGPDAPTTSVPLKPGDYIVETRKISNFIWPERRIKRFAFKVIDKTQLDTKDMVIIDIDGTIVKQHNRFLSALEFFVRKTSTPLPHAIDVVNRMINDPKKIVIFLTARPEMFANYTTKKTLTKNGFLPAPVFFRRNSSDSREESKIKFITWLENKGIPFSNIVFIGNSESDISAYNSMLAEHADRHNQPDNRMFIILSEKIKDKMSEYPSVRFAENWNKLEKLIYPKHAATFCQTLPGSNCSPPPHRLFSKKRTSHRYSRNSTNSFCHENNTNQCTVPNGSLQ